MKKNIIFILPELYGGGAEKTIGNLSRELIKNYNIDIILFRDTPIKYAYSGNLVYLPQRKKDNIIAKILFFLKSIKFLKKYKKDHNIDYSISFLTSADIINVFSKVKNTKNIISIRNTDSKLNSTNKLYKLCTFISTHKCDHVISISNQVKMDLVTNFKVKENKITTIYNPSSAIEFGNMKLKVKEDFWNNQVIINIGRLTHQKGQWHLIRAFSKVIQKIPNIKLIILGEGELYEVLQQLIEDYQLEKSVFLLGFVDNPYDYLSKSKLFVFSSLYEGLGNSILESFACGIPVLSTDCIAGPRELIAPNTDFKIKASNEICYEEYGVLIPNFSGKILDSSISITQEEKLLAESIIELMENDELLQKYKQKATERSNDFKLEVIVQQWIKVLENL